MSEPARLRVVDDNGELPANALTYAELVDLNAGLETDVRAWRARYAELKRDKNASAHDHALFPQAKELFDLWKRECSHPKSGFTPDRFWELHPHLEDPEFGYAMCRRAILGASFDPYTTTRKNGSVKRHDGWNLIFGRGREKAEEFANRAPR